MKIAEINLSELPGEQPSEQLTLTTTSINDFEKLKTLQDFSLQNPTACIVGNDYPSFLEKREELPYIFLLKEKEHEELLKVLAEHFVNVQEDTLPTELQKSYIVSLLDKVYFLKTLIDAYDASQETTEKVRYFVHKFAGNSGSYGFIKVSQLCKAMEKTIVEKPPTKEELHAFFNEVLSSFIERQQSTQPKAKAPGPTQEKSSKLDLIIIDDDQDLTKEIQAVAQQLGFNAQIWNDFNKAKDELLQYEAHIILVDINSGQELNGYDIMELFKENPDKRTGTLLGFLTGATSIKEKLKSIPYNVDFYLEKPLDYDLLFHYLTGLRNVTYPQPLRIVLLDDDADFCKQITTSEENSEIQITAVESVDTFFEILLQTSPHLVLIDYRLQELKGSDIIHLIRDSVVFRHLPVILISSHDDPEMFKETLGLDIAGFIAKPITKEYLQKRVTEFFQKQSFLSYLEKSDPIFNIYSHKELDHLLETLAQTTKKMAIATFRLEGGKPLEERKKFCKELKNYFAKGTPIGMLPPDHLILMTADYNIPRLQLLVSDFLKQDFPQSFAPEVGFAQYPEDGSNISTLGEKGIKEEKPQVILIDPSIDQKIFENKKSSLLISPDTELKDLISFSLFQWNIDVIHLTNEEESISWIKNNLFKQEPEAIIIDYDLEYDNGPILLEKIGNLVGMRIPIVILAGKKYQSNLSRSLQQSSISFVNKPINIRSLTNVIYQVIAR